MSGQADFTGADEYTVETADPLLLETLHRLLGQTCTHEVVQQAEVDGWAESVWEPLAGTGAPWVGVPETAGGSGGTLVDAVGVLRLVGRYAVPLPVAETGLLGGWLAAAAGFPLPDGPLTVVPQRPQDTLRLDGSTLNGVAHRVPWAARSAAVLALLDGRIVAVDPRADGVTIEPVRNLAGEPRETVRFERTPVLLSAEAPAGVDSAALRRRGALCRSAQISGACDRIAEMTVEYAGQRSQFGQKINRFQAVAAHLVRLSSEATLIGMALDATTHALGSGDAAFEVASLKSLAGDSGSEVIAKAHQVHGAIGMTREFALHHLSRRIMSWREEFGSTAWWREELGRLVATAGADLLWPLISEGTAGLQAS
jgi:acyl-CoA dehydrogenase